MPEQASNEPRPFPMTSLPGIKRDGTGFDGKHYTDGEWVRFNHLGKPRKMAGYRMLTDDAPGPLRGLHMTPRSGYNIIHIGALDALNVFRISPDGSIASGFSDRTPVGFVPDPHNLWMFGEMWDGFGAGTPRIFGKAMPVGTFIDSTVATPLYYGDVTALTALIDTGSPLMSGGFVVIHPYVLHFGDNGDIAWCDAGLPGTWSAGNRAHITDQKIIRGRPMRGGNVSSPAALLWSLNSLIRCTFNSGASGATFIFDHISTEISIIAPMAVAELDGEFFWLGHDRFYRYNGVVQALPNPLNLNMLLSRHTMAARARIWTGVNRTWGEIWWMVPVDGSLEPNWAFIYNKTLDTWYDTPIPENGRACGRDGHVFPHPIWAGVEEVSAGTYRIWQHEVHGVYDRVEGSRASAIRSFYETCDYSYVAEGPLQQGWTGVDRNVLLNRVEPDFTQIGDLTVSAIGRSYPRSTPQQTNENCTPTTRKLDNMNLQSRQMRFRVQSNTLGGFYEAGQSLVHLSPGNMRPVGNDGSP